MNASALIARYYLWIARKTFRLGDFCNRHDLTRLAYGYYQIAGNLCRMARLARS